MGVVDDLGREDTPEEDDDVHHAAAHIDMRQVKKLAVHRLATLISRQNNQPSPLFSFHYLNTMLSKFKSP